MSGKYVHQSKITKMNIQQYLKKRLYDRIKHKVKIKYILPKRARIITVKTDYIIG